MSARPALVALAATLAIQIFTSLAATSPAVLAPALAPDLGIAPQWIGVFVGLVYGGAMLGSLLCGDFIARFGAIRVSQACVLMCAVAVALIALLPSTAAWVLAGAAVLLGLGYGPITPASSALLIRTTSRERIALTFSIKQTGVPAGAAIAGAALPMLALGAGWRGALLAVAGLGVIVLLAAQSTRNALDVRQVGATPFSLAAILTPMRVVLATPELRVLALLSSAFSAVQVCLSSFLVLYLHESLQWSLVASGLALTTATIAAIGARIFWGVLADRVMSPRSVLALIGAIASASGLGMAMARPDWAQWSVLLVAAIYGASAIGWNGVQLAELARRSPPGLAGAITGASGFITFGGVVAGPTLFAGLAAVSDGYRAGFFAAAALSGITAACVGFLARQARTR